MDRVSLSTIVKAYDVRGIVPDELDGSVAEALGSAFAQVVALPEGEPGVVVGHDMRASSPDLARRFADGVTASGVDVKMIGLCSTDGLYYASGSLGMAGAMVTASHNPAQYNGIKLCRSGARPVGADTGLVAIRDTAQALIDQPRQPHLAPSHKVGTLAEVDVLDDYASHLRTLVDLRGGRRLKVVVDAANGMAGLTVPAVLDPNHVPVDVVPLYFELDGSFPNHEANPLDEKNLRDLQAAVLKHRADVGLAFDGDADRCFFVDEQGGLVNPSAVIALVAEREITKEVASGRDAGEVTIVHGAVVSDAVTETVHDAGARAVRTRVGHSFVKAVMANEQAVFGGEHSGHYYFRDFWYADTGLLAAMHVLKALAEQQRPLSLLVDGYSPYAASGEVNSTVADVAAAMARVRAWAEGLGAVADTLDGLTMRRDGNPTWWFSLRPSNTEPVLRLNVESNDGATMEHIRDAVLRLVQDT